MHESLKRILKLRVLTEETRRTRLMCDARELARIEAGISAWDKVRTASREEGFDCLNEKNADGWLLATAEQELACWQRARLLPLQAQAEARVNSSRMEFLESRKERRQGELLLESKLAQARADALRREQGRLDEWFQLRRALRHREKRTRSR
jgi:hypothetical protein